MTRLERRALLRVLGGGAVSLAAGCASREGPGSATATPGGRSSRSPPPTATVPPKPGEPDGPPSAGQGASATDGERTEPTATDRRTTDREVPDAVLVDARSTVAAALATVRAMDLYDADARRFTPNEAGFDRYDPGAAIALAVDAREALDGYAGPGVGAVRAAAEIAASAAALYDRVRATFRAAWRYEHHTDRGRYEPALDALAAARAALGSWERHALAVNDGLRALDRTGTDPGVDVRPSEWATVAGAVLAFDDGLDAAFEGFDGYTRSLIRYRAGLEAYADDDLDRARSEFDAAQASMEAASGRLAAALDLDEEFFEPRTRTYYCRVPGFVEGYTTLVQAANERARGNDEAAADRYEAGNGAVEAAVGECA